MKFSRAAGERQKSNRVFVLGRPSMPYADSRALLCAGLLRENPALPTLLGRGATSLDQVVIGSATPVGASQWGFFRFGSRAFVLGSRGTIRPVRISRNGRKGRGEIPGCNDPSPLTGPRSPLEHRSALRVVAPWSLFTPIR